MNNAETIAQPNHDLEQRVARTEAQISSLASDVRMVNESVNSLAGEVRSAINSLASKIGDSGKTQWTTLASVSGVIIAGVSLIAGAIGSGYVRDLGRIDNDVKTVERATADVLKLVTDKEFDRGVRSERLASLTAETHKLDEALQREMRLLTSSVDTKLNEVDRRLQGEIRGIAETQTITQDRQRTNESLIAGNRERIIALERQAFKENRP